MDIQDFLRILKCPNCGAKCEDEQEDSGEEFKEEYCGNCDEQFGYEERIEHFDNLNNWQGEQFEQEEERYYWAYKI